MSEIPETLVEKAMAAFADSGCIHEERGFDCTTGCRPRAILRAVMGDIGSQALLNAATDVETAYHDQMGPHTVRTTAVVDYLRKRAVRIAREPPVPP